MIPDPRPQATSLLRFAWALTVLNEEVPNVLFIELHSLLGGSLPSDWSGNGMRQLQEVALQRGLTQQASRTQTSSQAYDSQPDLVQRKEAELPTEVAEWLALALEAPREDLYAAQQPPRAQRRRRGVGAKPYSYEQWLSVALSQLRIPHQAGGIVACHRAAVVFRQEKHVIDVLDLQDLTAPAGRVTGSAELRRRQLMTLGWAVHSVTLRELYDAVKTGSTRFLVSKLLSSFNPGAARRASFASSVLQTPKVRNLQILPSRARHTRGGDMDDVLQELSDDDDRDKDSLSGSLRKLDARAVLHQRALQAAEAVARAEHSRSSNES